MYVPSSNTVQVCSTTFPNCKWFSFFLEAGVCQLMEDCVLDTDRVDVVSGQRECYLEAIPGWLTKHNFELNACT